VVTLSTQLLKTIFSPLASVIVILGILPSRISRCSFKVVVPVRAL